MAFPAGRQVTIEQDGVPRHFIVEKAFEPFTLSVVLLVHEGSKSTLNLSAPPLVLKIYDTRYLTVRKATTFHPYRPWTPVAEKAAAERSAVVARGEMEDTFNESDVWEDYPPPEDVEGLAERMALWEEVWYREMANTCQRETLAYRKLQPLQGQFIPKFMGEGQWIPDVSDERFRTFPAIILEYIPGTSLLDTPAHLLTPALYQPLVEAIDNWHNYGVAHSDLHMKNIIVSPPTRMVVIDFGSAYFSDYALDARDWQDQWRFHYDDGRIRFLLAEKDINIHIPVLPFRLDPREAPFAHLTSLQ